jgi:hypothetical protein
MDHVVYLDAKEKYHLSDQCRKREDEADLSL